MVMSEPWVCDGGGFSTPTAVSRPDTERRARLILDAVRAAMLAQNEATLATRRARDARRRVEHDTLPASPLHIAMLAAQHEAAASALRADQAWHAVHDLCNSNSIVGLRQLAEVAAAATATPGRASLPTSVRRAQRARIANAAMHAFHQPLSGENPPETCHGDDDDDNANNTARRLDFDPPGHDPCAEFRAVHPGASFSPGDCFFVNTGDS